MFSTISVLGLTIQLVGQDLKRYEFSQPKMGTEFRLIFYCDDDMKADSLQQKSFEKIDGLNMIFSDYEIDSEASQLSKYAGNDTLLDISFAMSVMISRAMNVSELTGGLFDITIGPLTKLWRRAFRRNEFPTSLEVEEARDKVGFLNLEHHPDKKLKLKKQGMSFDFGAVAKGVAVDDVFRMLKREGINMMLIDGGGDIRVGDAPLGTDGWVIALENGNQIKLVNKAIASSGSTFKFLEWEGKKYSHIIDPRTGYGITDPKTVTVKATTCFMADMIATTYCIAGHAGINALLSGIRGYEVEVIE